ncbi:MAG: hypothetical protein VYD52_08080, partial [Pseudomonadota bacterium]|nr:hypothetical protein [Pseudomonadota bacterium]
EIIVWLAFWRQMLCPKVDGDTLIAESRHGVRLCLGNQKWFYIATVANEIGNELKLQYLFKATLSGIAVLGCVTFYAGRYTCSGRFFIVMTAGEPQYLRDDRGWISG